MDEPHSQVLEYGTEDPQYGPGLRGWINRHPRTMWTATAIIVAVALGYVLFSTPGFDPRWWFRTRPVQSGMAYYSDDSGANWFLAPDSVTLTAIRGGRTAYRCYVYTCDGQTQFSAYLGRFPADMAAALGETKATLEQLRVAGRAPATRQTHDFLEQLRDACAQYEVMPVHGSGWVKADSREGRAIMDVRCPHGGQHTPHEVPTHGIFAE